MQKSNLKMYVLFPLNFGLSSKKKKKKKKLLTINFAPQIKKQCRHRSAKSQSLHTLLHETKKSLFFTPQNQKAMQTLPHKITET